MGNQSVRLTSRIFRDGVPVMLNRYAYDHYDELQMHCHDFVEIAYVCQGKGRHVFGDRQLAVSRGDLFIINVDTPHCFYPNDTANTDGLTVYNCMFRPDFPQQLTVEATIMRQITHLFLYQSIYSEETGHAPILRLAGRPQLDAEGILADMLHEYGAAEAGYIDMLRLMLGQLLIILYRAAQQDDADNEERCRRQLIGQAIDFLQENYADKLSLDRISQQAYLSRSYFSALFRKTTGISVFDYIQKLRIGQACRLLAETGDKVTAIASAVGYSDYRFFNQVFRKLTGVTAQEYRRKYQK